jgi:hypothetical protein
VAKSAPFSLRLSEKTDRLVTAEAKRTKRSKGSIVETLTEEAEDSDSSRDCISR